MKYEVDMRLFWETNDKCKDLKGDIPRVPVDFSLDDWIGGFLGLDYEKYYTDFDYQQESRLRCGETTMRELAYPIHPAIDFGVIMDSSLYGGEVNYEVNATPTLRPAVGSPEEIDALIDRMARVDILGQGLIPKYLEWNEKLRARYAIRQPCGGGMKGCATSMGQICGITNFLTWIVTNPGEIKRLISCWLETSKRYIPAIRKATGYQEGAGGFYFASDVAGMMSPGMYREFILDAERELFDLFCPDPGDRRFYHADSHMLHQLDNLREIGVSEVNVDPYADAGAILAKMPDATIFGQIPPTQVLLYGSPDDVMEHARMDIGQAGPGKHLVLAPVGDVNPGTSLENLKALCYAAEKYGYIYGR